MREAKNYRVSGGTFIINRYFNHIYEFLDVEYGFVKAKYKTEKN